MDNRVLNINGKSKEDFLLAMKIAFLQSNGYGKEDIAKYWGFSKKYGFVLCKYKTTTEYGYVRGLNELPVPLKSEMSANLVWEWLQSDEAKSVELEGWFADADHDGHNSIGWRVYVDDWGHVGSHQGGVIVAITPAHLWHGK